MTSEYPYKAVLDIEAYRLWYRETHPPSVFWLKEQFVTVTGKSIVESLLIVDFGDQVEAGVPEQFIKRLEPPR